MAAEHSSSATVFDTTTQRFIADVIERSRAIAVAVDFWAPWCGPCRALAPILEQLVAGYGGRLAVARVNIDEEPAIANQFGIRSIPDVRIFRGAKMVDGFVGVQPLSRLQALFDRYVARASEAPRNEARELLAAGRLDEAIAALEELIAKDPTNDAALVDLADAFARAARIEQAEATLARLPVNAAGDKPAERVRARLQFVRDAAKADEAEGLRARYDVLEPRDQYRLAAYDLVHGDVVRGLEGLLALVQRHRKFEEGLAQRALLQAFTLLGDEDERVATYRRRMAALLY